MATPLQMSLTLLGECAGQGSMLKDIHVWGVLLPGDAKYASPASEVEAVDANVLLRLRILVFSVCMLYFHILLNSLVTAVAAFTKRLLISTSSDRLLVMVDLGR